MLARINNPDRWGLEEGLSEISVIEHFPLEGRLPVQHSRPLGADPREENKQPAKPCVSRGDQIILTDSFRVTAPRV